MQQIHIATRESRLALRQANHVKALLETNHDRLQCEIVGLTTQGDRDKSSPLSQMGGKGVFVKELEIALLEGRADIAVHSMKDVPTEMPDGLAIVGICERANPRDAFVANHYHSLDDLPDGAVVGSSSLRRILQIRAVYPHLIFRELRGNVETRLRKLDEGHYDAIILAVAGLTRLGFTDRIVAEIKPEVCLPAAGQGAIGIEARIGDNEIRSIVSAINHEPSWIQVCAERRVTACLGASCDLPIAVFAELADSLITLRAFVADPLGRHVIQQSISGQVAEYENLAAQLGDLLLELGAADRIG